MCVCGSYVVLACHHNVRSHPLGVTEISQMVYGQDDGDGGGYGASGGSGNPLFAEYNVSS